MSTPTPAPLLPVAPLDGAGGYLRWKESVLLRLRTLDMAHVLFGDSPPAGREGESAKKWARDDELCRGHILATLYDRLLPDYAHHATAVAVWRAVARTYDLEVPRVSSGMFHEYEFVQGVPVLEQLAHLEALATVGKLQDDVVAFLVRDKLPSELAEAIADASPPYQRPFRMEDIWETAQLEEAGNMAVEILQRRSLAQMADKEEVYEDDRRSSKEEVYEDDRRSSKRRRSVRGPC